MAAPKRFTVEHVTKKVNEYFALCERLETHPKITSLCLAIGFCSTCQFYAYLNYPEYNEILSRARLRIEEGYEGTLLTRESSYGSQFALRVMGWKDKQVVEVSSVNVTAGVDVFDQSGMDDNALIERMKSLRDRLGQGEDDQTEES